jgi:hypothetical protein
MRVYPLLLDSVFADRRRWLVQASITANLLSPILIRLDIILSFQYISPQPAESENGYS